mgnify:CR=1 FL=1
MAQAEDNQDEAKQQEKETVIRAPQTQQITNILTNYNIPLSQNKAGILGGGALKSEDTQKAGENKKKLVINKVTTTLYLQNN